MNKQKLKISDLVVNKQEFYASKQAIPLDSVNTNNITTFFLTGLNTMMMVLNILLAIHMMMMM